MEKVIIITNCFYEKKEVKIENFEEVYLIRLEIISGDETLEIYRRGYSPKFVDSSDCRCMNFHDGQIVLYDKVNNIDLLEKFSKGHDVYDLFELLNGEG